MAERRPLVIVTGRVQELPTGDTLPGAGAGSADYPMLKALVPTGETLTIPTGYQFLVGRGFTVDGSLEIDGELHVVS
jgi:hypothetical protein